MPPQVRDLQTLIAEQNASLAPQYGLIEEDIVRNAAAGAAQEGGLAAAKEKEFKNIGQRSQNKGMFFSGVSPNEELEYTAGTYLPALAQLQATIAGTRSQLLGKKAELGKSAFDTAFNTREADVGRKFQWDENERQRQFQAEQALKAQIAAEQEAARDRAFKASEGAKDRSASAANSKASQGPTATQNMAQALSSKTGDDGYVSPGTYSALKSQWTAGGYGDAKQFDATFAGYRNPKNKYYKIG